MPPEARPILMMTMLQTDGLNPPRWSYEGQSFIVIFYEPVEKLEMEYVETELVGRRVEIERSALRNLAGRTLCLRRVSSRYGLVRNTRYVLVADSVPESPLSAFAGDSNERIRRVCSVAALTILGGFTGMGVIWIAAAIIVSAARISNNKFFSITTPLFVFGWIVGAIVSFYFFRSWFTAEGKTQFAQEQKQRKYLGSGTELDLWVFMGIPVPLIAISLFALEPLAHTDGQKSWVAVGTIVVIFAASMYFFDRIRRQLVFKLGILGWVLAFALGYLFFKIHGP